MTASEIKQQIFESANDDQLRRVINRLETAIDRDEIEYDLSEWCEINDSVRQNRSILVNKVFH